jgi:hypothetical protein
MVQLEGIKASVQECLHELSNLTLVTSDRAMADEVIASQLIWNCLTAKNAI